MSSALRPTQLPAPGLSAARRPSIKASVPAVPVAPLRRAGVANASPRLHDTNGAISGGRPRKQRLALLTAVADLCAMQSLAAHFESFAGRSAMLGVSTALVLELLTEESLLRPAQGTSLEALGALALACVLAAGAAAAVRGAQLRSEPPALLEPVLTSLTAVKRAACSVTAGAAGKESLVTLDWVVDEVMESAFTRDRINVLTDASAYDDA